MVEAGAQGEHKLARGYLPQTTYSAHYIADPDLRRAIADYLKRERAYVAEVGRELTEAGPFRKAADEGLTLRDGRADTVKAIETYQTSREAAMPAYDTNNPFAKILRGEFPCHKVYEDDHVLAFLDIMPRSPGHTLVIPKAPARNILDITPDDYAHVARAAHKIAAAAMKAFKADGITVQQFNEPAGGQVVFHLHMHVMPRHDGVALLPPASRKEDVKVLEDNATKLVAALG